jgi:acetyl-CoA C-acetyltransferase
MRDVSILGVGCTKFGVLEGVSLKDLAVRAARMALTDAGVGPDGVQELYVGNFAAGMLVGQELLASAVANALGMKQIAATKVEAACASAGVALRQGFQLTASGMADVVLIVGVEKMTSASTAQVTTALNAAMDGDAGESHAGLTFPGFFASLAQRYFYEFDADYESLALVALKNRANAQQNPGAHFYGKPASLDQIRNSRLVADPLRLYDCSPISDGAAAAVLVSSEARRRFSGKPVLVRAAVQASGPTSLKEMQSLTSLSSAKEAAQRAYEVAGVGPGDIDVAEVHDCFSIAEVLAMEDLGFSERGRGGQFIARGATALGGRQPVNPSGGLLSKGHPVGATGLAQVFEVVRQLRGEAENQVENARIGLTHNVGGTGGGQDARTTGAAMQPLWETPECPEDGLQVLSK